MKTNFLKPTLTVALIATMFSSCVKDEDYATPQLKECTLTSLVKTKEVAQIPASSIVKQYLADDVIEAYVTSSDIAGNFFKSISFETLDKTMAFSVPVDVTSTYLDYEPGRKVFIKMKDLYTDINDGGMRIGGLYGNSTGGAEVGRLTVDQLKASLIPSCTKIDESLLLPTVSVTVAQAKNDSYLNKLIEINDVEFSDCDISSTYYDVNNDLGGATNHTLIDKFGSSVILRISSYANFASKTKASGSGKIRGVMTKYGSDYQFMVRTENDIKLGNTRFDVLLNETFDSGIACWTNQSVVGSLLWSYATSFGNPKPCVSMSGYFNSSNQVTETWLISPKQNLSSFTNATLSFDTAAKYGGNLLKIYLSSDYVGYGTPTDATWTEFTGTLSSVTGNFVWTNSGNINISSFTGAGKDKVYIGFKYTSTSAAAPTWEVDNVKVIGN